MMSHAPRHVLGLSCALLLTLTVRIPAQPPAVQPRPGVPDTAAAAPQQKERGAPRKTAAKEAERQRAIRALAEQLAIRPGATIIDIGAGTGRDSWVFADIVGPTGRVISEEISEKNVSRLKKEAQKRKLDQVKPLLGKPDDPGLPPDSGDLAYMHSVYHHFTEPRKMLRGIWRALKPGGCLVIVDRHRGTLQDWVARAERGPKHFWIAETTVVREAREEGFAFVRCGEDVWPAEDQFVLIFQRPATSTEPGTDPDPLPPLDVKQLIGEILPGDQSCRRPVFIALGPARAAVEPVLRRAAEPGLDIVLEEWATQKTERPAVPDPALLPAALTKDGVPELGDQPLDLVLFLDTYHLLFHHEKLLASLHGAMAPAGRLFVLDRAPAEPLSRRLSSHHRRIAPQRVIDELAAAGFALARTLPAPSPDRFLLEFTKKDAP